MKKLVVFIILISAAFMGCLSVGAVNMDFADGSFLYQEDNYLLGVPAMTSASLVKSNFDSSSATVDGKSDSDLVGTGAVVKSTRELIVVVKGDVNGDARVSTSDYILQKKSINGATQLEGAFYKAADVNNDDEVSSADYLQVKKYFTGKADLYEGMSAVPYKPQFEKKDYSARKAAYRMDRDKINIGLYGWEKGTDNVFISKDYLEEAKNDFGADFIASRSKNTKVFNWCAELGLGVISKNVNFTKYTISSQAQPTDGDYSQYDCLKDGTYKDYDCIWGEEIYDEPVVKYYSWMSGAQNIYSQYLTDKFAFFNLMGAPDPYMGSAAAYGATTYEDYVAGYVENVDSDYICFDIYPFDNTKEGFNSSYLYSMDTVATAAKETGRDFWIIMQSGSTSEEFKMTPAQLQWQVYTSLAYGATNIMYASYMPWWFIDNTCMVNNDGTKTNLWAAGQEVNQVVHKLSPVFMDYEWLGVDGYSYKETFMSAKQMRQQIVRNESRGYGDTRGFKDIQCETGLLVGSFEHKEGDGYAMMLVESCDAYDMNVSSTVTFRVADSSCNKVTAYPNGEPQVLTPVDGVYTVELKSGQGCFVTVE